MMQTPPPSASLREQQLAMAILAHAARHDSQAIADSLALLTESAAALQPVCVIAALLTEFQHGMSSYSSPELAQRFADRAVEIAANNSLD